MDRQGALDEESDAGDGVAALPDQERLRGARKVEIPNGFEIDVPEDWRAPWSAINGTVGVTVFTANAEAPSKTIGETGQPAHLFKNNQIKAAMTPNAYTEQWLVAELNGVFTHVRHDHLTRKVNIVVADHRLC